MNQFNLIDEKWIPVRFPDGSREDLGIRDTLLRAKEIATIEDPSPLVVAALHRFLLAVLYRALEDPTDIARAKALFKAGLPGDKIKAYLDRWHGRFDLFDQGSPFLQVPGYLPKESKGEKTWKSWTVLAAEHNADNAKVLFDHIEVGDSGAISPQAAARWLLASQTFALGGGNSDFQYTKSAPSATAAMAIPIGMNLEDTLLFGLSPQNREIMRTDLAIWEKSPDTMDSLKSGPERIPTGLVDLYTWRTRSVRLDPDSNSRVSRLAFASGVGRGPSEQVDPMLGYRIDEDKGKLPIQFRELGIWRDFDSLLPDQSHLAPQVIEHAIALTRTSPDRFPQAVMILGQLNDKAKIVFWRMERFALPKALSGNKSIRAAIRQLLDDANDAQGSLYSACCSFARDLLSRGDRKPAGKDIKGFVGQMPVNPWYWSSMESRFHEILREYTLERDSEDIRCQWLKSVRNTLRAAWDQHRASVSMGDAWAIRALAKAEGPVCRKLKYLDEEIQKYEPQKEDT